MKQWCALYVFMYSYKKMHAELFRFPAVALAIELWPSIWQLFLTALF